MNTSPTAARKALERLREGNRRFVADVRSHQAVAGRARRLELAALSPGERDAVHRFQRHLTSRLAQLDALHRLRRQSNGRITERLDLVEAELTKDLEGGRALLEELADRVALAQVATLGLRISGAPDRLRLETLIARADALVQETSELPLAERETANSRLEGETANSRLEGERVGDRA